MSEDDLLAYVVERAGWKGWLVYHIRDSRAGIVQGHVGFPDLVLSRRGRVIFAELKSMGRNAEVDQQIWLSDLAKNPGVEVYLWRPKDLTTIDKTLE